MAYVEHKIKMNLHNNTEGVEFWFKSFGKTATAVPWRKFQEKLERHFSKKFSSNVLKALNLVLLPPPNKYVTIQSFSNVLGFYGPLKKTFSEEASKVPFFSMHIFLHNTRKQSYVNC